MTLEPGFKLGPYEIIGTIGSGGMGVVYKARDSRLKRTVAIKVVSDRRDSPEFQQQLRKEAKAASALSHQHIIAIYDVLGLDTGEAIVMEFVEGQSLREAFEKKAISTDKTLDVIAQVATALAFAHKSGIVHRDIKPENIIITPTYQAKVLDFGIAKVLLDPHLPDEISPTQTVENPTQAGIVRGTLLYMSPEQAQGQPVDWRTDIFALGVVLYEALSGKRPFTGSNTLEVMNSLLYDSPPPVPHVSPALQDILEKALAKDTEDRYQSASDFALDLRRAKRTKPLPSPAVAPGKSVRFIARWLLIPALLLIAYLSYRLLTLPQTVSVSPAKLTPITTDAGYEGEPSFFPDGETIAYVSDRTGNFDIFLRQVSGGPDVNLTNDPSEDVQPSVSPDGRWISFVSTRQSQRSLIYMNPYAWPTGGDIWVMPGLGGPPRRIVENGNFPSWSNDGSHIIYTAGPWGKQQIYKVSSSGGTPDAIPIDFSTLSSVPIFLYRPSYSSDGRWIVFEGNADHILCIPSTGGKARKVGNGRSPTWSTDGKAIIYSSAEVGTNYSLHRISFDPRDGSIGKAEPLTIGRGSDFQPSVSPADGKIAFSATDVTFNIERVPFEDDPENLKKPPEQLTFGNNINWFFDTSPDGQELVFESLRGSSFHIWKRTADGRFIQLTSDPLYNDVRPKWSPDGKQIAYMRTNADSHVPPFSLCMMSTDGANPTTLLNGIGGFLAWMPDSTGIIYNAKSQYHLLNIQTGQSRGITDEEGIRSVHVVSPDGRWLIYSSIKDTGTSDLRAIPISGGPSIPVLTTPDEDGHPFLSGDSKWLYYQRDHKDIFRFPGPAQDWRPDPPIQITFFPGAGLYLEDIQRTRNGKFVLYSRGVIRSNIWLLKQ